MALTRKFLSAMGIDADKIDEIINAHAETVDGLKEEMATLKADAEKLADVEKKLETANAKIAEFSKEDSYKVKYEAKKEEFEKYKKDIEAEKEKGNKTNAFKELLKSIGISDKRIESVMKVSSATIDDLVIEDGKIKDADKLKASLKTEWEDFIVTDGGKEGADVSNPPENNGGNKAKSMDEISQIKDTTERQKALKEYLLAKEE